MQLITWNMQWGRGADGRVDLDRIVNDARRFADFDVLCMQEVCAGFVELPGADESDQFNDLAARLSGFHAVPGIATDVPGPQGTRRRFGNMILSRYPVMQTFVHLLPWPAESGVKCMQRVAVEATLASPLGLLRVTTTHLEYYSARQRHAQVERLRDLQREGYAHAHTASVGLPADGPFCTPARGAPSILSGDFNCLPDSPDYALLTSPIDAATPRYVDAWKLLHNGKTRPPSVGLYDKEQWPDEPFTFDFIFVSEDLRHKVRAVRTDTNSVASDHQPVLIELGEPDQVP